MVAGIFVGFAIGDLPHRAAQDLARAGLGQTVHDHDRLEGRHRPDLVAHQLDQFLFQLFLPSVDTILDDDKPAGNWPFSASEYRSPRLGDGWMAGEYLLHAAGRKPVAGHIDDVVGARHDEQIAVLVDVRHRRFCSSRGTLPDRTP
jgi:hypothetical protein